MSTIFELRQYTLQRGQRDVLIELFEREFIESQEAVGMDILGTFRDADNPDRFVWLRGFPDMVSRAKSLAAFYGGPVWKAHREAANATMIDSDNVLLLREAWPGSAFRNGRVRPPIGTTDTPNELVIATIWYFDRQVSEGVRVLREAIAGSASVFGAFVTEDSPNTFPQLPVREGEAVFVWFAAGSQPQSLPDSLAASFIRPPEILTLQPTARSLLRG